MARPTLPDLEVRQQYLSLVYQKKPGEADWTLISQARTFSPDQNADTQNYSRIGDKNQLQVPGVVNTTVEFELYVDDDIEQLARVLGFVIPPGGWTGSEIIEFDPTAVADYKIENYDGITAGANLLWTEYINQFKGTRFGMALESEGVRVANVSGTAAAYYIIPEAGLGG